MSKKIRRILFFVLLALFLVIAPITLFHSLGYRFDFQTKKITKTGAFYFKVFPKNVQIYLTPLNHYFFLEKSAQIVKKTDFFFRAVFVKNLLPKKYKIEIKKEGFHSWEKILEIEEEKVTDAKNVILFPKNPETILLTTGVKDFFVSPDKKIIILEENGDADEGDWNLKIFELEKNLKSHLINSKTLSESKISLQELKFSLDSKKILLKGRAKEKTRYFLIDLKEIPPAIISLDFLGEQTKDVFFHPDDNQKLFFLKEENIFEINPSQKKIPSVVKENVNFFQIINKDIYYSLNSEPEKGFIFKTDSSFSKQEKINKIPFLIKKGENYKLYLFLDKIFFQEGKILFLFDSNSSGFVRFAEINGEPKISPDSKKLVYCSDQEIEVLFLKEDLNQPIKKEGEKQFIARFSEKIGNIFWLTAHYLIFTVGDKIKISEIDNRDKINMIDFLELKEPKILWGDNFKKLYILSTGNFYWSEFFLP